MEFLQNMSEGLNMHNKVYHRISISAQHHFKPPVTHHAHQPRRQSCPLVSLTESMLRSQL